MFTLLKEGHTKAKCWKFHSKLRPKRFGNKKTTTTIQQDLGMDSGDETKITAMGIQDTSSTSSSANTHSLKYETMHNKRKRSEPFHIRVISKYTNIDTLFYSGM
jgi:hypothetical protein